MKGGSIGGGGNSNSTGQGRDSHVDHLWARMAARQQDQTSLSSSSSSSSSTATLLVDPLSNFLEHAIAISSNSLKEVAKQEVSKQGVAQEIDGSGTERK